MDFEQPRALEQIIHEPDKSFWWLTATHFLGEMNDKYFKLLGIFFVTALWGNAYAGQATAIGAVLFVSPFLFLSPVAGLLADRVSKQRVIALAMAAEVPIMVCCSAAIFMGNAFLFYSAVLFKGVQCALFRPAKYGIVPELVSVEELSSANSFLESSTYVAFICGTGLSYLLPSASKGVYALPSLLCPLLALAGFAASLKIKRTKPAEEGRSLAALSMADAKETFSCIVQDRHLLLAVLGTAYFMMIAAFAQMNLYPFGIEVFSMSREESGLLFLLAATGIAAGSLLTGKLSGKNIEIGLIPAGALLLTFGVLGLGFPSDNIFAVLSAIVFFGMGAGLFIVPIYAFIQLRAPRRLLGKILAISSLLSWSAVLLAGCMVFLFNRFLGFSARQSFAVLGVLSLMLTVASLTALPDFFVRTIGLLVTNLFYRLKVIGGENLPSKGPGLLIPNHVTWADALFLLATGTRHIRFVMERRIYNGKLRSLFKLMGVIPISSDDSPKALALAFREIRKTLERGHLVCVFSEGEATTGGGFMRQYKEGFERIVRGGDFPIIPVYIGGAWGSIFSYAHGRPLSRLPQGIPYPVTVVFGEALRSGAKASEVRQAVAELSCLYFEDKKFRRRPLIEYFVGVARRKWVLNAMADANGKWLSYGQTLVASLTFADLLRDEIGDADMVGVFLPPSVRGALVNLALSFLGKIPLNLASFDSVDALEKILEKCPIETIVATRDFSRISSELRKTCKVVFLEDLFHRMTGAAKLRAWLRAGILPVAKLCSSSRRADELAAIVFSSGRTGDSKAVMLSGHNIISNVEAVGAACAASASDSLCSAISFSKPLGLVGALWFPLLSGFSVVFHDEPSEGKKIAETVKNFQASVLLANPDCLLNMSETAEKDAFASLRMVVVGGGKLETGLADAFETKFGVRPLESYGAAELTLAATLNVPDMEAKGKFHADVKSGSVGRPLPGVAVKVVAPENFESLSRETPGLILVRGPNVAMGYYNEPEMTSAAMRDGWFVTGDAGKLDEDDFVWILNNGDLISS